MSHVRLAPQKSCFLFGPRQTGKSVYVRGLVGDDDLFIDLLPRQSFFDYGKNLTRFRAEVEHHARRLNERFTCVIDEIQKNHVRV